MLGVLPALGAALLCLRSQARGCGDPRWPAWCVTRQLVAGWACSTLVLAAYWTLLTRWSSIVGGRRVRLGHVGAAAGRGRGGDPAGGRRRPQRGPAGPRTPMVRTMGPGRWRSPSAPRPTRSSLFLAEPARPSRSTGATCPWSACRSSAARPADARAAAAGVLYSSMWLGAALGGLAAVAAPNWRFIVGGAALSWACAGLVAWRGFLRVPSRHDVVCGPGPDDDRGRARRRAARAHHGR